MGRNGTGKSKSKLSASAAPITDTQYHTRGKLKKKTMENEPITVTHKIYSP